MKYINNNIANTNRLRIVTLLPIATLIIARRKAVVAPSRQPVAINLVWFLLESSNTDIMAVINNFIAHNPKDPLDNNISFH